MEVFVVIIACIICGFITKSINQSKGYDGGFAWGFWLTIIGIVIVAVRPFNNNSKNSGSNNNSNICNSHNIRN
jgi:hypothetical protein